MNLKFILLAGVAAIASFAVALLAMGNFPALAKYVRSEMATLDPSVVNYSKQQVQTMLASAKTILPRRDGPGKIEIWGAGRSGKGVTLNMKYASWAPLLACEAVITAVSADKSRVVADCSPPEATDSAIDRTQQQLQSPMFEEHIQSILQKRAFNRANVDLKSGAIVFSNLGSMQREALQRSREFPQE
jgi:hypothetical protein